MRYREVTGLGEVGRLLLFILDLEDQVYDSNNEHTELKDFIPCNVHVRHPLSFDQGQRSISPPKRFRGTAYRGTGSTVDSITRISANCK